MDSDFNNTIMDIKEFDQPTLGFDWTAIIVEAMVNFFTMVLAIVVGLLLVKQLTHSK